MNTPIDLDTPRFYRSVELFFIKPSKADLDAAKTIAGKHYLGTHVTGKNTVIRVQPPYAPMSPKNVMANARAGFGHIKSYDGSEMLFADAPESAHLNALYEAHLDSLGETWAALEDEAHAEYWAHEDRE